jgi:hypothetical protein
MPTTTADGLPYPLPTEPVRDGAANISALANALSRRGMGKRFEIRRITVTPNGFGNAVVTFGRAFANIPTMTCMVWGDENQGRWATFAGSQLTNAYIGTFIYNNSGQRVTDTVQMMYVAYGDDPNV